MQITANSDQSRFWTAKSLPASLRPLLGHSLPPEMLDFWLTKLHPLWSVQQPLAQIVARQVVGKGSVSLTLKPNRHVVWPAAGQHVSIGAMLNGRRVERSYSPSPVPDQPDLMMITVKQVTGGRLSNWLYLQAQEGDILHMGPPFGEFCWPEPEQPMLLLAAGSGITPMISLLRQHLSPNNTWAATQKPPTRLPLPIKQSVQLHYWVSQREEACFIDELLALQQHQPNFSLQLYLTQSSAQHSYEQNGRIQASQFAQQQELANTYILACGPAGFVASAQQILQTQVKSFQAEAFSLSSNSPSSVLKSSIQTDGLDNKTVQISLQRQQRQITVPIGQSILAALEAQGIAHPSGCRMGLCNTCACAKLSGSTQHLISGEQQHDENPALRLCVSMARSDLVLDI